ncbi:MAG: archease [Syntrophales bacterium]
MKFYKIIDHTADMRIEVSGRSEKELFANAAAAIFDLLCDPEQVKVRMTRTLIVAGMDRVDLLINFLREVLYLFNGENLLIKKFSVTILNGNSITAEARGEPFDPGRHAIKMEIKAVTYHQAEIKKTREGWRARVIFDV